VTDKIASGLLESRYNCNVRPKVQKPYPQIALRFWHQKKPFILIRKSQRAKSRYDF